MNGRLPCIAMLMSSTILLSSFRGNDARSLLTSQDYELEIAERTSGQPALSSPMDEEPWESFNHWLCFSNDEVQLQFSAVDYRGWKKIPTVVASSVGHRFEISLSPEVSRDHDQVIMEWVALMNESSRICVYAAYLQPIADDGSLWTLARIKTEKGYWKDYIAHTQLDNDPVSAAYSKSAPFFLADII